jgi:hypothetical protein
MPAFASAPVRSLDEYQYFAAYLNAIVRSKRTPLLVRALFVAAISTLEPLVTRMIHLLLHDKQPQRYTGLNDVNLDSDARKLAFGDPSKWRKSLSDLGVAQIQHVIDWDRIDQLWQDRHVMTHRGAIVDASHSGRSGIEIGTVLSPGVELVRSVIDEICIARTAIVAAVWDCFESGVGLQLGGIGILYADSLRSGRWRRAEGISRIQQAFASDPIALATAQVNRWLALERGIGADAIRDLVQAWDLSGLPSEFQMARHVLLHEDIEALRILGELIGVGTIDLTDLDEWPLLDRFREDGRLDTLTSLDANGPTLLTD